ncbi:MAG: beta galactosidase jelly roll domain-containing protein [Defluviitaleaceae bacterium]|nr:beta galactosidase jelly roll domain-containing protein [Defluviitaleaceae bacterium]
MIKLPTFFSDGMVISKQAKIWGWAEPKEEVNVEFLGENFKTVTESSGRFEMPVTSNNYGGPHTMKINDIQICDVYVGRVWLCGGQSNMEQPVLRVKPLLTDHIKEDVRIRAFQVEKNYRFDAQAQDVIGQWHTATGDFLNNLFAVPYFFARELAESDIPIGLINVAAGGTPAEGWLPEEIVKTFPELYKKLLPYKDPNAVKEKEEESNQRVQEWYKTLQAKDLGIKEKWHSPNYDDSSWDSRMLLDSVGLPEHGAVWYRKDIFLPEGAFDPISLSLGQVVNNVKVYVNGIQVIAVDYQYPPCVCNIPEGVLKVGKNVIAVRVVGDSRSPSFTPGKQYELSHKNGIIDLKGPWKWRVGSIMPHLEPAAWLYNIPCCVYNYMLAPILGYSIEGVIWYQGESNTPDPQEYKALFTAFVEHLREHFGSNLPVIYTQLANFIDPYNSGINWAVLREQQRQCLDIPNTAMAVTIDCGEWNDLHPQDKKTVGERLALCAKNLVYGEDAAYSGPMVKSAVVEDGMLTISFDHAKGLWANNGHPMLEIEDLNGSIYFLYAKIKGETLVTQVHNMSISRVRFGWIDCPTVILYNAYGLPASPFEVNVPVIL